MKIPITDIGNIGKSTLKEKVANIFLEKIIQIDMDILNIKRFLNHLKKLY